MDQCGGVGDGKVGILGDDHQRLQGARIEAGAGFKVGKSPDAQVRRLLIGAFAGHTFHPDFFFDEIFVNAELFLTVVIRDASGGDVGPYVFDTKHALFRWERG